MQFPLEPPFAPAPLSLQNSFQSAATQQRAKPLEP
jgi:hypothetical protein